MSAFLNSTNTSEGIIYTFKLPHSFQMPLNLLCCSQQEFCSSLFFASTFLEKQNLSLNDEIKQKLFEDFSQSTVQKISTQLKKSQEENQSLLNSIQLIKDSQIQAFEPFKKHLEIEFEKKLQSEKYFADEKISHIKDSFSHIEQLLQAQIKDKSTTINEQNEKITSLENLLLQKTKSQNNSQKKGKDGEEELESIVFHKKGWNLTNVGKSAHSADSIGTIQNLTVRFETKNYTNKIPLKEVEKLRNDMNTHPDTDMGVFVSLNTPISGMDNLKVEWTSHNQLILYISNFLESDIETILDIIEYLLIAIRPYRELLSRIQLSEEQSALQEKISRSTTYIQNLLKKCIQNYSEYDIHRKALQDRLDLLHSSMKSNFASMKSDIETILSILTDSEINTTSTNPEITTPTSIKSKRTKK
jgi:hypothetical protein